MSWQAYVDTNLVGTKKIEKAAILGQGGGVWAASAGYILSPQEQAAAIASFTKPDEAWATGIRLCGRKFFTIHAEGRSVYGKQGTDGCILVQTKQAVLIAEYAQPTQAQEATPIVENLADYLISLGF